MGKQRHIELNEVWLQDQVGRGRIKVRKIDGEKNISDSLTKHCKAERIEQTVFNTYHVAAPGRHALMPSA